MLTGESESFSPRPSLGDPKPWCSSRDPFALSRNGEFSSALSKVPKSCGERRETKKAGRNALPAFSVYPPVCESGESSAKARREGFEPATRRLTPAPCDLLTRARLDSHWHSRGDLGRRRLALPLHNRRYHQTAEAPPVGFEHSPLLHRSERSRTYSIRAPPRNGGSTDA